MITGPIIIENWLAEKNYRLKIKLKWGNKANNPLTAYQQLNNKSAAALIKGPIV